MKLNKNDMLELSQMISTSVVAAIKESGLFGNVPIEVKQKEKTAYQKTEQLLYNYNAFKRLVEERYNEIAEIEKYGVPKNRSVQEFIQKGGLPKGIVLEEESVESAVQRIIDNVQDTVQVISMIDKCMAALSKDPYYKILEMRYFEGRTQEDIASEFGCSQVTISNNKHRLVRELSMRIFPNQVAQEMLQ